MQVTALVTELRQSVKKHKSKIMQQAAAMQDHKLEKAVTLDGIKRFEQYALAL
jgi:hypothetical protein